MNTFRIKSNAKINLALNIIGKKVNLHKIESIVSFIDLYDLIYLNQIEEKNHQISFKGKFSKNIQKKNSVSNLLKLLDQKNLLDKKKFKIKIVKNIPQKSGMGGGSMNAASLINFIKPNTPIYFIDPKPTIFERDFSNLRIIKEVASVGTNKLLSLLVD